MEDIKILLAEQHRNTRHDAVDIVLEVVNEWNKNKTYMNGLPEELVSKICKEIQNLKQREPEQEIKKDQLKTSLELLQQYIDETPEEERIKFIDMFKGDSIPEGWISIEDHLPKCLAVDFMTGTSYLVRNISGEVWYTSVMDHDAWYHIAKRMGITHWWNSLK